MCSHLNLRPFPYRQEIHRYGDHYGSVWGTETSWGSRRQGSGEGSEVQSVHMKRSRYTERARSFPFAPRVEKEAIRRGMKHWWRKTSCSSTWIWWKKCSWGCSHGQWWRRWKLILKRSSWILMHMICYIIKYVTLNVNYSCSKIGIKWHL